MGKAKITPDVAETPVSVNPHLPRVALETWKTLEIESDLVPGGVLKMHRPSRREEPKIRAMIRQIARDEGIIPEDLDGYSRDVYYMAAFSRTCIDTPSTFNWLDIETDTNDEEAGLQKLESEVFRWLTTFSDSKSVDGGTV